MAYVRYRFGSAEDLQNGYVVTKAPPICTAQLYAGSVQYKQSRSAWLGGRSRIVVSDFDMQQNSSPSVALIWATSIRPAILNPLVLSLQ